MIVSANGIDPGYFVDGPNLPLHFIYASHPFYGVDAAPPRHHRRCATAAAAHGRVAVAPTPMTNASAGAFSCVWAAAGMETLLKAWPRIHERLPDSELHIYYGFTKGILRYAAAPGSVGAGPPGF